MRRLEDVEALEENADLLQLDINIFFEKFSHLLQNRRI